MYGCFNSLTFGFLVFLCEKLRFLILNSIVFCVDLSVQGAVLIEKEAAQCLH